MPNSMVAPYKKAFIKHQDIMKGGVLEFAMIGHADLETAFTEFRGVWNFGSSYCGAVERWNSEF